MQTPFDWIAANKQKPVFVSLVALTVVVMICLQIIGGPLVTDVAPGGIVTYEFAGDVPTARAILESWGAKGQVYAGLSLGLDFLFLFAYAGSIGLGCVLVGRNLALRAGVWLAWGLVVAAFLDYLENYALIRNLLGSELALWPAMARWCAIPKFVLVGAGLLFVFGGGVVGWYRSLKE
jgi:hypothetical protein